MSKTMLIDAAHAEETRVVVLNGQDIEEFDVETKARLQLRGNIYLAKVTRVEPSLQACFVDFGNQRHGFLAFSEVHPDYYQIPVADKEALLAEEAAHVDEDFPDDDDETQRARRALNRKYKIQDVLKRRQIMLVQAVKEERGNKGAALTTYLSLAGRYCVLMPNTPRGGGISRKITAVGDRKRLKTIVSDLHVPKGMGLIIRTAGAKRNKTEIKRDYEYLLRLWDDIRTRTLESVAPTKIHEEESLVKRAIRDLYNKDVGSIIIEGESAYKEAKDFVKMLIPSHTRKVHQYKNTTPLYSLLSVDDKLKNIHSGIVQLKSGGYIVINQTEALVAVDVNSGKSTKERSIEQTALKTNLEAADEVARQMRMRDLAGLIVIDFIDMEEPRNDRAVEKRVKDALRFDRARVQMGKISNFGLMEISRQRRRTGILEGSSHVCEHCNGFGRVRSASSTSTQIIREIETILGGKKGSEILINADNETASFLLNEKRAHIAHLEASRNIIVKILASSSMPNSHYEIDVLNIGEDLDEPEFNFNYIKDISSAVDTSEDDGVDEPEEEIIETSEEETEGETSNIRNKRRRNKRRNKRNLNSDENNSSETNDENSEEIVSNEDDENETTESADNSETQETRTLRENMKRRRRGRRGGRNRRDFGDLTNSENPDNSNESSENNTPESIGSENIQQENNESISNESLEVQAEETEVKKPKPRTRKKPVAKPIEVSSETIDVEPKIEVKSEPAPKETIAADAGETSEEANSTPNFRKKTGWWARNASKLFGNE